MLCDRFSKLNSRGAIRKRLKDALGRSSFSSLRGNTGWTGSCRGAASVPYPVLSVMFREDFSKIFQRYAIESDQMLTGHTNESPDRMAKTEFLLSVIVKNKTDRRAH